MSKRFFFYVFFSISFCLQAELLEKLSENPCIVSYVDSFELKKENQLCIVMEYCDDGDLATLIDVRRKKRMPFSENVKQIYFVFTFTNTMSSYYKVQTNKTTK